MYDASSKIPTGIASGNKVDLGQFDQCLNVDKLLEAKFEELDVKVEMKGKYCSAQIKFSELDKDVVDFEEQEEISNIRDTAAAVSFIR